MSTIKSLIGRSVEDLEKMSDTEMEEYCKPYLRIVETTTAAEDDEEEEGNEPKTPKSKKSKDSTWMEEARKLAEKHGIKIEIPNQLK